jgi:hypothetical protein
MPRYYSISNGTELSCDRIVFMAEHNASSFEKSIQFRRQWEPQNDIA